MDEGHKRPALSVVVPVYKNEETLPEVIDALTWLQGEIDGDVEAVWVIDGSPDGSAQFLTEALPNAPFSSQLLCHSRNFGAFAAIRTGFGAARGEYVAAMAADLQEPVDLVKQFYLALSSGEYDVAVGSRTGRQDPGLSKVMSAIYWRVYRRVIQPQMPAGGVDIFACTSQVAGQLDALGEAHSSLVGLLYWLGYRRVEVPYERVARKHGTSAWSFSKKLTYFLDSIFSFTSLPITLTLLLGAVGTVLSFTAAVVIFVSWLTGAIDVPGYTATMLVLLMSTGTILLALGVVGTYVWRAYENTKGRPLTIVMRHTEYAGEG